MSRIGRLPVTIPSGVDLKIDGQTVTVKGPKGQLARTFHPAIRIAREPGTPAPSGADTPESVKVTPGDERTNTLALHALTRKLIANIVPGVTTGVTKDLKISGTGHRAALARKKLQLALGF